MAKTRIAKSIRINGVVQGVGFRPFVFQLAQAHKIAGEVANTDQGVRIHAEGPSEILALFIEGLESHPPPLAIITEMTVGDASPRQLTAFSIVQSQSRFQRATLISPDVAVCADCLQELFDPQDRRYRYPFINCTNCGPRYTIIADVPYDRPHTSMHRFIQCRQCQTEYDDPLNRRFHAQPNACSKCGPQVSLCGSDGQSIECDDPIARAARLLKQGAILAVKGLGGFHLAVDACHAKAVQALRNRKHREEKPFALMAADPERIRGFARFGASQEALLASIQRPIVLLDKCTPNPIASQVAPHNRYFGVMLPYTPLHYLLLEHGFVALVMTSANLSEEPICIDNHEALERLAQIADYFLMHDRDILLRSDDAIVRHCAGKTRFLRRSRGYVPIPVFLKNDQLPSIGCGAELKNTICLTRGREAFLSQHIGDLENEATLRFFEEVLGHLKKILDIEPQVVGYDLHPDYFSTRYAQALGHGNAVAIQHHWAHIVSCMAEHHLVQPVIGLAFDGTGYGSDGHIWGGEFLVAELHRYQRLTHLDYVPMPGGAAAIKEPWRMAIAYLWHTYGDSLFDLDLSMIRQVNPSHMDILIKMVQRRLNSPLTSSLGRLFDGVAALVGLRPKVRFEGQAAMELEMTMTREPQPAYELPGLTDPLAPIDLRPVVRGVVADLQNGIAASVISSRFHATLVEICIRVCRSIRRQNGLNQVVLSGGVFQNGWLLKHLLVTLSDAGFEVFAHQQVPTNDGGISLGQAVAAAAVVAKQT